MLHYTAYCGCPKSLFPKLPFLAKQQLLWRNFHSQNFSHRKHSPNNSRRQNRPVQDDEGHANKRRHETLLNKETVHILPNCSAFTNNHQHAGRFQSCFTALATLSPRKKSPKVITIYTPDKDLVHKYRNIVYYLTRR